MVDEVETAGFSHGVKLVIGKQFTEMLARGTTGAIKLIVRIIHLIAAHHGFQAAFVERAVVRHEGQALNEWFYLSPNIRKHRCIFRVFAGDAVDKRVPIVVVVRLWLNEGIERIHELPFPNDHHAHATHAGALVVGGLEIYGGEGVHFDNQ